MVAGQVMQHSIPREHGKDSGKDKTGHIGYHRNCLESNGIAFIVVPSVWFALPIMLK